MRLAVEVTTCTPGRAGIGYYTEHLVDALLATVAPEDDVVLIGNARLDPVAAARWAGRLHVGGAPLRFLWMQVDAPRLLARAGAEFAVFPNYLAPLVPTCPYLPVVHDLALLRTPAFFNLRKRMLLGPLLPLAVAGAAAVGTVSEASRRDVAALLGVPPERTVMLPGAPHPSCRPPPPSEVARVRERYRLSRPYVLSVGTLEPRKNLPTLLRAFDLLAAGEAIGDLDLVLVGGRGWRDRELRTELAARRSSGRVHVLGYVPEADLVALYGGAELLAYPSHFEGFGLPVLEAMACGTPVVASEVAALAEVSGGAAVLVPPEDATALAGAISRMVGDPSARRVARARGLLRAAEFGWERTARRLWELARSAAKARPSVPPTAVARPLAGVSIDDPTTAASSADSSGDSLGDSFCILATVAYADMFDAAITADEVARSCVGAQLSPAEVRRRAAAPPLAALVELDPAGHLTMRGRQELVPRRLEGARLTAELLDRHQRVIAALATLPYVRMLALSGGTAHRNARGGDDIDLFVVAASDRVYTVYTLMFLASQLTRTRGVVCPNYLVDERHLLIAYNHDLFTAHQAISLVPIAGDDTFARFNAENDAWVRPFFPGYAPRPSPAAAALGAPRLQQAVERAAAVFGNSLERALRAAWRLRFARRVARAARTDVVIEPGILKLHFSDHRRRTLARFEARLAELRQAWNDATAPSAKASAGAGAGDGRATAGGAARIPR